MAQDMTKFITGIVIVGVTLVLAIFIAAEIQSVSYISTTSTASNETHLANTTLGTFTLDQSTLLNVVCGSATNVTNSTNGAVVGAGNYTQTGCTFDVSGASVGYGNYSWGVTYPYTYDADSATSNASGDLVTALSGGTAWITILVVVGFATIVLGMLTTGLGKSAEEQSAYVY